MKAPNAISPRFTPTSPGGHFENANVQRAVDGHLTCILGREAAARKTRLTMEELLKENKKLEVDLKGLKA